MPSHDVAVITQPLIDVRGHVLGREVRAAAATGRRCADAAGTSALLLSVFGGLGLEDLTAHAPVWLPIAHDFLLEFELPPVRPDRVVLQVRDVPGSGPLPAALDRLESTGYTLALDGYDGRPSVALGACTWVKVDARTHPDSELAAILARSRACGAQAVATGVGADETLARCRALGFEAFQGSAVADSRLLRRRLAGVCSTRSLEALEHLAEGGEDEDLGRLVASDPGLALTLLHYVGAAYAAPPALASVREALDLVGPRIVRRWASMLARVAPGNAREDIGRRALRRARACEAVSGAVTPEERASYFTVGLLSVADELAGVPLADALDMLPLAPDVRTALLARAGPKGDRLATVLHHEEPAPV
jgi:c-di-GMP phosphodiesterase